MCVCVCACVCVRVCVCGHKAQARAGSPPTSGAVWQRAMASGLALEAFLPRRRRQRRRAELHAVAAGSVGGGADLLSHAAGVLRLLAVAFDSAKAGMQLDGMVSYDDSQARSGTEIGVVAAAAPGACGGTVAETVQGVAGRAVCETVPVEAAESEPLACSQSAGAIFNMAAGELDALYPGPYAVCGAKLFEGVGSAATFGSGDRSSKLAGLIHQVRSVLEAFCCKNDELEAAVFFPELVR